MENLKGSPTEAEPARNFKFLAQYNGNSRSELGSLRDAGHTYRHPRPASGHTRDVFSGDGVHAHLWDEGCCPRGCLYDGQAGTCLGRLGRLKGKNLTTSYITHGFIGFALERPQLFRLMVRRFGDNPTILAAAMATTDARLTRLAA